ncbi:MAG: UDP-glucose/GDP-mannose dehydrogenase family protein [Flavobacteriaceae bacterium]|nr:UDP-glucose/GDP-mannose dehydrogenase family protein [Flavobacteriaceae bacterium]
MKVVIIGVGYVGLVTGTCFAEIGIDVECVDIDKQKIQKLKKGISPIYEPGLDEMLKRNIKKKRLFFSTNLEKALQRSNAVFICVGTPSDDKGKADLKFVYEAAKSIGKCISDYMLVVTKSTVPVGTSLKVKELINEAQNQRGVAISFDIASNPEFLKEGAAISDFLKPDRIVIGVESDKAASLMKKLYKPFTLNGHPIFFMDPVSAEMTKYVANAMLATKISFINDIANLCELVGANINEVRKGIGSDQRIGKKFIYPGIGYGGSCFPKDVKVLIQTASDFNYDLSILKAVEHVNLAQKEILFHKINKHFKGDLSGKHVAIWGLSFKPQTDDMREAPSLVIIRKLLESGATVSAYDPVAIDEAKRILGDSIKYCDDEYEVLIGADCLAILTEWSEFKYPNFKQIKKQLNSPTIFDGRNIFNAEELQGYGFNYHCIGNNLKTSYSS